MSAALPLSRRAALATGAAGGAIVLTACDLPGDRKAEPRRDPDVALVASVVAAVTAAREVAVAGRLPALAALHREHLVLLDAAPPETAPASPSASSPGSPTSPATPSSPTASPSTAPTPRAAVLRTERRLERTLTDAAVSASSGRLAAVFAAMAAAVGQRTTVIARRSA